MKLSEALLGNRNIRLPLRVIGNGYGCSNVPKGALGTVVSYDGFDFEITWDHVALKEKFTVHGGLAMDLDVL